MHLVLLRQSCHGWESALVNALMLVCCKSPMLAGVKLETTDVKPAMSVVMHQRRKTLMCSVSNERSSPNSAISLRGPWQSRRRRWQKRHLKSKLVLFQTANIIVIISPAMFNLSNVVNFSWFDVFGLYLSSEKNRFVLITSPHETLNYEFSRRSRAAKVKKCKKKKKERRKVRKECVNHVQSCCFAHLILYWSVTVLVVVAIAIVIA